MSMKFYLKQLILFCSLTLFGCVAGSPPEAELGLVRTALLAAENAGAPELAPTAYQDAKRSFAKAENLIVDRSYEQARSVLAQATILAQSSYDEAVSKQKISQNDPPHADTDGTPPTSLSNEKIDNSPEFIPPKDLAPPPLTYTVQNGDNLWSIAARSEVYGDPLLWPLLYQGNRDQIKDPRQVYTGQTLKIQRNLSDIDREEARNKARSSDIFPIGQTP